MREHLQAEALWIVFVPGAVNRNHHRTRRREFFDGGDIGDRLLRVESLGIAAGEGLGITVGEHARPHAIGRSRQCGLQFVNPGRGNGADPGFQRGALDERCFAFEARDDVVDARKRSLGEGHIGSRRRPLVGLRQEGSEARPHVAVVFFAWDEDEDGDETIELVYPRERPHAGTFIEDQDLHDEVVEGVDVDLEQIVARIFFDDMRECLARMAVRVETGALQHLRHLVADVGDLPDRAGVDGRGEQTEETQFAIETAVGRKELDTDIVHPDPAMNAAADIGLDDDEEGRLAHELANFRRHHHHVVAAAQDFHIGIAQDAEAFAGRDIVRGIALRREAIFAQAQKGEIVRAQPLQELAGFSDLVDRQGRRIGREGPDRFLDAGPHGAPVRDADTHVVQRLGEAVDQPVTVGLGIQAGDVEVNQAFACAPCSLGQCLAVEMQQLALHVALHCDDRMHDQRDFDTLLGEFRQDGIEQEGHVVVENFEYRDLASVRHHRIDDADIGTARGALLHMLPSLFCQEGQGQGIVASQVLGVGMAEQKLGKGPRGLARLHTSRRIADQGRPGVVVTPRHHSSLHF